MAAGSGIVRAGRHPCTASPVLARRPLP